MHGNAGVNIAPAFGGGGAQWWSTNLLDLNDVDAIDVEGSRCLFYPRKNIFPSPVALKHMSPKNITKHNIDSSSHLFTVVI